MLTLQDIQICYGSNRVVEQFSWHLDAGDIGCLLGSSGSGKTSILKAIAGFKAISTGGIHINDNEVSSDIRQVPPEQRQIGMMFQDLALFPHLNVARNITFGLQKLTKDKQQARLEELLDLVDLVGKENAMVHELSGGQQQRVALARALAPKPNLLLLDEPFSSLDKDLRESLATQIRQILKAEHITALLVTHDHVEAFTMADKIAVLNKGHLVQSGTPYEVYHRPDSPDIARFLGICDYLPAQLNAEGKVATPLGTFAMPSGGEYEPGAALQLLVRPDDVVHDDNSAMKATVVRRYFKGAQFLFELRCQEHRLHCYASAHHDHKPGDAIGIRFDMQHSVIFPAG
ncbi:ABC transporter ATP-binding protein [Planctobacterium marinum]|uniref:ABC transporter ATP-binding protein n=1 Tax=Planctobacterium marinum TaxID=1631968 RepID=UPI001E62D4DE|nr:ABC transporter ATP-binding protein [Planctobacterium marinum]MCC2604479.1 ABC transporter ATP-binding protein [Planctobacterium marinum]